MRHLMKMKHIGKNDSADIFATIDTAAHDPGSGHGADDGAARIARLL